MISTSSRGACLASLVALLGGAFGCVGPGFGEEVIGGPSFGGPQGVDFAPVSAVLERRCGTLDCHGSVYRPLRIYGQLGLRKFETAASLGADKDFKQYFSGGGVGTTAREFLDNYNSVIGLEPELTLYVASQFPRGDARVLLPCPTAPLASDPSTATTMTPDCLSLFRKPRLQEKHKGGQIWERGTAGDKCLEGWLQLGSVGDYRTFCDDELAQNR